MLMYFCDVQEYVSVLAVVRSGSRWEMLVGGIYMILYLIVIRIVHILLISIPFYCSLSFGID